MNIEILLSKFFIFISTDQLHIPVNFYKISYIKLSDSQITYCNIECRYNARNEKFDGRIEVWRKTLHLLLIQGNWSNSIKEIWLNSICITSRFQNVRFIDSFVNFISTNRSNDTFLSFITSTSVASYHSMFINPLIWNQ